MKKTVTILGSTGSIGTNSLDLIHANPDEFAVNALVAGNNVELLAEQAKTFQAKFVALANEDLYHDLKDALAGTGIKCGAGEIAVMEAASLVSDITISAIVGFAGLRPSLRSVENGNTLALANKESLVCAGDLMMNKVAEKKCTLLPVDSEHNAIYQVFDEKRIDNIKRLILTASGGPFLRKKRNELSNITPSQAIAHPNWSMGAKISVDSATMMNKALELIEAYYLFSMPHEKIDVIIHPQSIVHSMVEYIDGSILAQMGASDMRTPIAYALAWPERMKTTGDYLDITKSINMEFIPPDTKRFPMLALVRDVLDAGGSMPIVFNAANEVAVDAFLKKQIPFLAIENIVSQVVESNVAKVKPVRLVEDVFAVDAEIRKMTLEKIKNCGSIK